jgi:hypothetical protein
MSPVPFGITQRGKPILVFKRSVLSWLTEQKVCPLGIFLALRQAALFVQVCFVRDDLMNAILGFAWAVAVVIGRMIPSL